MSRPLSKYQKYKMLDKYLAGNHSLDFLEDFSNVSSHELYLLGTKRYDALCAWNNLQRTPTKRRNFTFTVFESSFSDILPYVKKEVPKWAYILHDKDEASHNHYHLYLEFENPRSFASVANSLHIPVNQLQAVISKKGILNYLTHENEEDKFHYSVEDLVSNFDLLKERAESEMTVEKVLEEFEDYCKMRRGEMTSQEFIKRHAIQFVRQQFSNRLSVYERSFNAAYDYDQRNGRACPRSEFRVPP